MARKRPEEEFHRTVAEWLSYRLDDSVFWFHCPNGGARSKAEAGIFKALGVKPGVSDIIILWPDRHALFIELKAGRGHLTDAQEDFHAIMRRCGFDTAEARTLEEIDNILDFRQVPTRFKAPSRRI